MYILIFIVLGCENTCGSSSNGVCEDGGSIECDKGLFTCKSKYNFAVDQCDLGTDCADCGNRGGIKGELEEMTRLIVTVTIHLPSEFYSANISVYWP